MSLESIRTVLVTILLVCSAAGVGMTGGAVGDQGQQSTASVTESELELGERPPQQADSTGPPVLPRNDSEVYVGETVTLGYPAGHDASSYEWTVRDGPNESDEQLLHTGDGSLPPHEGRVTSFRPTDPGQYTIAVTVDGETHTRTVRAVSQGVYQGQSRLQLLQQYAPDLHFHPDEAFYPTRYEAYVENAELYAWESRRLSPEVANASLLDIGVDPNAADDSLFLDPTGDESDFRQYQQSYPETVYGTVHENVTVPMSAFPSADGSATGEREYTALVYRMFYVNDPKPDHASGWAETTRHTGDQEPVVVLLNESGPQWVAAQQHFGGELRSWETVADGGNLDVYPALGAHSNFLSNEGTDERFLPQHQYFREDFLPPAAGTPTAVDSLALEHYHDVTGSGTEWSADAGGDTQYQIAVLSGDEGWANYTGNLYTYPELSIGSRADYVSGHVPQQSEKWGENLPDWLADSVYPGADQRNATIKNVGPIDSENRTVDVVVANDGPQPHEFVLEVTGTPADGSGTEMETSKRVYVDTGEIRKPNNAITGSIGGSVVRFVPGQTEVTVDLPADSGADAWDFEFELWEYGQDRASYHLEDTQTLADGDITPRATDARVTFQDRPSGSLRPGEDATSTVQVRNVGTERQRFFVGYSAVGPDGAAYDNDGATGTVTAPIGPGNTTTVDVAWTVTRDLPAGSYDLKTVVWAETDRTNLQTALDNDYAGRAIQLAPEPEIERIDVESAADGTVTATVNATNRGVTAEWQSIAVSFPSLQAGAIEDGDVTGQFDSYARVFERGETVGADYGTNTTNLTYPLVEAAATDWETGETRTLRITLPESQRGELAYVKSVASGSGGQVWTADPTESEADRTDQQSEGVYTRRIEAGGGLDLRIDASDVDGAAGGAQTPGTVAVPVELTQDGEPFADGVDPSTFDVRVGGRAVETDIAVSSAQADGRPGEYTLYFVPPEQSRQGTYDLSVTAAVDDAQATDEAADAISYTGGQQAQIAAVQIIDRSGSMETIISEAKESGRIFTELSSDEDRVSVVSYASRSRVDQSLVQLGAGRRPVLQSIDGLTPTGSTNIGSALQDARAQLDDAPEGTTRAAILLTDGKLNTGPTKEEILQDIVPAFNRNDYCLYTIGFTDDADEQFLRTVADRTDCGFFRQAGTEPGQTELRAVYESMKEDVSEDSTFQRTSDTVPAGATVNHSTGVGDGVSQLTTKVRIPNLELEDEGGSADDATAGGVGTVPAKHNQQTSVELVGPDGRVVDVNDPDVDRSFVSDTVIYRVSDPAPGTWQVRIQNGGTEDADYRLEMTGSARTRVDVSTTGDTYYAGTTALLRTTLAGPGGPVSDATVEARVTGPDGNETTLALTEQSDGVYSGGVPTDLAGDYNATVTVTAENLTRVATTDWTVRDAPALSVESGSPPTIEQGSSGRLNLTVDRPVNATGSATLTMATTNLSGANGTIAPDRIETDPASVTVLSGDSETVSVVVAVPEDAGTGTYEGTLRAFTDDGGVVETPVSVSVSEAVEPVDDTSNASTTPADDGTPNSGGGPGPLLAVVLLVLALVAGGAYWYRQE